MRIVFSEEKRALCGTDTTVLCSEEIYHFLLEHKPFETKKALIERTKELAYKEYRHVLGEKNIALIRIGLKKTAAAVAPFTIETRASVIPFSMLAYMDFRRRLKAKPSLYLLPDDLESVSSIGLSATRAVAAVGISSDGRVVMNRVAVVPETRMQEAVDQLTGIFKKHFGSAQVYCYPSSSFLKVDAKPFRLRLSTLPSSAYLVGKRPKSYWLFLLAVIIGFGLGIGMHLPKKEEACKTRLQACQQANKALKKRIEALEKLLR